LILRHFSVDSVCFVFFFSSRRRHTRFSRDWSSDVCSSDLPKPQSSGDHENAYPELDWSKHSASGFLTATCSFYPLQMVMNGRIQGMSKMMTARFQSLIRVLILQYKLPVLMQLVRFITGQRPATFITIIPTVQQFLHFDNRHLPLFVFSPLPVFFHQ